MSEDTDSRTGWTDPYSSLEGYVEGQLVKVRLDDEVDRTGIVRPPEDGEYFKIRCKGRELPVPYDRFPVAITAVEALTENGRVHRYDLVDVPSWAEEWRPPKADRDGEWIHRRILELAETADDEIVSSAHFENEIGAPQAVSGALRDLMKWGEFLCVNIKQHCRVTPNRSARPPGESGESPPIRGETSYSGEVSTVVWTAHVSKEFDEQYGTRVFSNRDAAIGYLDERKWGSAGEFRRVPYLNGVWIGEVSANRGWDTHLGVVRCEPVYDRTDPV